MKTPAPSAFTVQINSLMSEHAARCPHARAALAAFAAGGESSRAYMSARLSFSHAYAARAERDRVLFLSAVLIANVAAYAALFLSLRA
jgi:hypothetical protein